MVDTSKNWDPIELLDFPEEIVEKVQHQQKVETTLMATQFGGLARV